MQHGVFTIGADPEVALVDIKTGLLKSAIPFITGTKKKPLFFSNGANIQRDNVACEFAIPPVQGCEAFVEVMRTTMKLVVDHLPKTISIVKGAAMDFPEEELQHAEAKEFGCDPDFDAWMHGRPMVCDVFDRGSGTLRSFGGHIHVGYVKGSGNEFLRQMSGKIKMIQVMDALLGLASVIHDKSQGAIRRRELYGKAGAYRPTPYGVEYRTLSNFWIFEDKYQKLMWHLTNTALRIMRQKKTDQLFKIAPPSDVREAINTGDFVLASKLLEDIGEVIVSLKDGGKKK